MRCGAIFLSVKILLCFGKCFANIYLCFILFSLCNCRLGGKYYRLILYNCMFLVKNGSHNQQLSSFFIWLVNKCLVLLLHYKQGQIRNAPSDFMTLPPKLYCSDKVSRVVNPWSRDVKGDAPNMNLIPLARIDESFTNKKGYGFSFQRVCSSHRKRSFLHLCNTELSWQTSDKLFPSSNISQGTVSTTEQMRWLW